MHPLIRRFTSYSERSKLWINKNLSKDYYASVYKYNTFLCSFLNNKYWSAETYYKFVKSCRGLPLPLQLRIELGLLLSVLLLSVSVVDEGTDLI